jgi:hypothetical protein
LAARGRCAQENPLQKALLPKGCAAFRALF